MINKQTQNYMNIKLLGIPTPIKSDCCGKSIIYYKYEDKYYLLNPEMRCSEHCGNTVREAQ